MTGAGTMMPLASSSDGLQQDDAAEEGSPAVRRLRHLDPPESYARTAA